MAVKRRSVGTGIGTLSTLLGIGGETLTVPLLVYCNVPIHQAVGTSAACGLPIALAGAIGLAVAGWGEAGLPAGSSGYPYWPAVAAVVARSAFLAPLGARLAHALPVATPRWGFAAVAAPRIAVSRRLVCSAPNTLGAPGCPRRSRRSPTMPVSAMPTPPRATSGSLNPASPGKVRSTVVRSRIVVNNGPFRCDALFGRDA